MIDVITQTLTFFLQNHCLSMSQKTGNGAEMKNNLSCKHLFNVFRVSPGTLSQSKYLAFQSTPCRYLINEYKTGIIIIDID